METLFARHTGSSIHIVRLGLRECFINMYAILPRKINGAFGSF